MYKKFLSIAFVLALCFGLAACRKGIVPDDNSGNVGDDGKDSQELAAPVLEWWELYNPNGFDTFTGVIYNPNSTPVELTFDLVYYKDGKEVARNEGWYSSGILPKGRYLVWGNWDVPKKSVADEVKLENVIISEPYYKPIDGKYKYIGTTDGNAFFDFTFDSKPTLATISFLLYNDLNGNNKFDKGETVVVGTDSLMEKTGRVSFSTDVYYFTNYEVFFSAY